MIDEMKEQKAKADRFSWGEDGKKLKRPRPDEDNSKVLPFLHYYNTVMLEYFMKLNIYTSPLL